MKAYVNIFWYDNELRVRAYKTLASALDDTCEEEDIIRFENGEYVDYLLSDLDDKWKFITDVLNELDDFTIVKFDKKTTTENQANTADTDALLSEIKQVFEEKDKLTNDFNNKFERVIKERFDKAKQFADVVFKYKEHLKLLGLSKNHNINLQIDNKYYLSLYYMDDDYSSAKQHTVNILISYGSGNCHSWYFAENKDTFSEYKARFDKYVYSQKKGVLSETSCIDSINVEDVEKCVVDKIKSQISKYKEANDNIRKQIN